MMNGRYEHSEGVFWYLNDEFHRDCDLPAIEYSDGAKHWYQHGKLHRDNDLPAYIGIGEKCWYQHGKLHRTTGPAIICSDGTQRWHLNGKQIDCKTQAEFLQLMRLKAFW
jgi:hypothetical protein